MKTLIEKMCLRSNKLSTINEYKVNFGLAMKQTDNETHGVSEVENRSHGIKLIKK